MTASEEDQDELTDICKQLRNSDSRWAHLSISSLWVPQLDWQEATLLVNALRENKRVARLDIPLAKAYISAEGAIQLADFIRDSPSLRGLQLSCAGARTDDDEYNHATTSLLLAVIRNQRLTKLQLNAMHFKHPDLLERILSSTTTLKEFKFQEPREGCSPGVAKALRNGLECNDTLESLSWMCTQFSSGLEEALFGLSDHSKLTTLTLGGAMNRPALLAIKFFLKATKSLQNLHLALTLDEQEGETDALTHVLSGLASNRSLLSLHFEVTGLPLLSTTPGSQWTEMLEKNTTLTMLELKCYGPGGYRQGGGDFASAIAQGLRGNASLRTVRLSGFNDGGISGKLAWQRLLQDNKSLKNLILYSCGMTEECLVGLASGLSENSSLETLDISQDLFGEGGAAALADAVGNNVTLTELTLKGKLVGTTGVPDISKLWRSTSLKRLTLSSDLFGDPLIESRTVFPESLPKNCTLEYLDLSSMALTTNDFRCVLESMIDSPTLLEMTVADNTIVLDESLAVLLRRVLESTPVRVLNLSSCDAIKGVSVIVDTIRSNSTLRELVLNGCSLGDVELLAIGEAMVDNSTIQELNLERIFFSEDARCRLFELLPRMKGLKTLCLAMDSCDDQTGLKLVDAMKTNTTLEQILFLADANFNWEPVEFYLKMNRNGRKYLQVDNKDKSENNGNNRPPMPTGAWPLILAKMTFPSERDELFHFLRNKGDLIQCPPPSRKRKASGPVALDVDAFHWYDCFAERCRAVAAMPWSFK